MNIRKALSSFVGYGALVVIGLLAIPAGLGLSGVWLAYGLDLTVRGLLLLRRFVKGKWQKIQLD